LSQCPPEPLFSCHPEPSFLVTPSPLFLSPRALFSCHPEPLFSCHPERSEGSFPGDAVPNAPFCRPERSERCLANARQDRIGMSPRAFFYCRPERSEGSLGTYAPREDTDGLSPRAVRRGVSITILYEKPLLAQVFVLPSVSEDSPP